MILRMYNILGHFFVAFSLSYIVGISPCFAENHDEKPISDSVRLIRALNESGINIHQDFDYNKVVETIKKMRVAVPDSYRKDSLDYIDRNANNLVGFATSKAGILSWSFENVLFLRKDLIFASYSDGEMYGGEILIKINHSEDRVISMRPLWNYHK